MPQGKGKKEGSPDGKKGKKGKKGKNTAAANVRLESEPARALHPCTREAKPCRAVPCRAVPCRAVRWHPPLCTAPHRRVQSSAVVRMRIM